jgi:DNA-binding IclR family transcriptional regulator
MAEAKNKKGDGVAARQGIQVIARAAAILRTLENESNGLSLGNIAKSVDLPRSTVQRIVSALAAEQLLIAATPNARVMLGPAIVRMAENTHFEFAEFVRPHLEELSKQTGETIDLSIQRGDKMVFVDQIKSNHRLSAVSAVGESFPTFSSANGKAALALLSDDEIIALLSGGLFAETSHTITKMSELIIEIEQVRKDNYAIDNEEHTEGICAVGTAFHDPFGRIVAVSVPVPTTRFNRSKDSIIQALLDFREAVIVAIHGKSGHHRS